MEVDVLQMTNVLQKIENIEKEENASLQTFPPFSTQFLKMLILKIVKAKDYLPHNPDF